MGNENATVKKNWNKKTKWWRNGCYQAKVYLRPWLLWLSMSQAHSNYRRTDAKTLTTLFWKLLTNHQFSILLYPIAFRFDPDNEGVVRTSELRFVLSNLPVELSRAEVRRDKQRFPILWVRKISIIYCISDWRNFEDSGHGRRREDHLWRVQADDGTVNFAFWGSMEKRQQ